MEPQWHYNVSHSWMITERDVSTTNSSFLLLKATRNSQQTRHAKSFSSSLSSRKRFTYRFNGQKIQQQEQRQQQPRETESSPKSQCRRRFGFFRKHFLRFRDRDCMTSPAKWDTLIFEILKKCDPRSFLPLRKK